jgi:hypothetical protein
MKTESRHIPDGLLERYLAEALGMAEGARIEPLLPGAIKLDETMGREDVYPLHSTRPFELVFTKQFPLERP